MMNLPLDDFSMVSLSALKETPAWQSKYRLLLSWGKYVTAKDAIRRDKFLLKSCQVSTWLYHEKNDEEQHYFWADSDSQVIKALLVCLMVCINGRSTRDILAINFDAFYADLGLERHLSASRNKGLTAVLDYVSRVINNPG